VKTTPSLQGKKLLLHICCAPDATVVLRDLQDRCAVTCHFYNPNIHPHEEYDKRLGEMKKLSKLLSVPLIEEVNDSDRWFRETAGFEQEPEGGSRCDICFRIRLEQSAQTAKERGCDCFTTVLTVSPHKDAARINNIGKELECRHGIEYIEADFKKNDGFKRSIALTREYGLYRQNYCGCRYSLRGDEDRE